MEPTGIEPATPSLQSYEHSTEVLQSQELAEQQTVACTTACTNNQNENPDDFAKALLMLARLPLTDAERVDALRRIL